MSEAFENVLFCYICLGKLVNAHLCPYCSKLCCFSCISKWISEEKEECPHCRAVLHKSNLVACRWFEDIAEELENLKSSQREDQCSCRHSNYLSYILCIFLIVPLLVFPPIVFLNNLSLN